MSLVVKGASPLQAETTYKGGILMSMNPGGGIDWGQLVQTGVGLVNQFTQSRRGPSPGMPMPAFTGGGAFPAFGAVAGALPGGRRPRIGKFSRQPIPPGTKEKFSKSGQIILTETHRAKGLSGRDLKGFRRTLRLIRSVGMHPKGLGSRRSPMRRRRAA